MRIIKEGNIKTRHMTCDICDCEFEYDLHSDVQYIFEKPLDNAFVNEMIKVVKYVVCPTCNSVIIFKRGYIRKIDNDTWEDILEVDDKCLEK